MGGLGLHALMTSCYSLFRMPMLPTTCCATTLCAQALLYALIQHEAKPDALFGSKPCPIAHVLFLCAASECSTLIGLKCFLVASAMTLI